MHCVCHPPEGLGQRSAALDLADVLDELDGGGGGRGRGRRGRGGRGGRGGEERGRGGGGGVLAASAPADVLDEVAEAGGVANVRVAKGCI